MCKEENVVLTLNCLINGMETCQKIPPNPGTPRVLKLQCANFANRVLN